jgi:protease-4
MPYLLRPTYLFLGRILFWLIIIISLAAVVFALSHRSLPPAIILKVDLNRGYSNTPGEFVTRLVGGYEPSYQDLLFGLENAAADRRVKVLIARCGGTQLGFAQAQEIRDAVLKFRRTGRSTLVSATSFGEFAPGNKDYFLATGFDEIYLQPSGMVALTGLVSRSPFFRGTLDKLGIKPQLDHRKEYKTAQNLLTETRYTPAHYQSDSAMVFALFDQLTSAIADRLGTGQAELSTLINNAPLSSDAAVKAGLIKAAVYQDQVDEIARAKAGKNARIVSLAEYARKTRNPYRAGKTAALIYAVGTIVEGKSRLSLLEGPLVGSDDLVAAFEAAEKDRSVGAVLLRIDSPGGSYTASDAIWRSVKKIQERGKPVVVSMSNVAASGGYFIAAPARTIVAEPGTLTGSIGVIAGKVVTREFWSKLGVTWGEIPTGPRATFWSALDEYTPAQWQELENFLDRAYEDFVNKVAEGRSLPSDSVERIARGRVWTGSQAKQLGLLDTLGGMDAAISVLRRLLKVPGNKPIRLKEFQSHPSLIRQFLAGVGPGSMQQDRMALAPLPRIEGIGLHDGNLASINDAFLGPAPALFRRIEGD